MPHVARLQAELASPNGVLGFLKDSGGFGGGPQIEDPVTTALQTLC